MNISELFIEAAKAYPEKLAIIDKTKEINYAELAREVKSTAGYFQQAGIKRGDRVLVFVPMGIDLYRVVLALFYTGATAVFLDEWVSVKRLSVCCKLAECNGFIGVRKAKILSYFLKELRRIPIKLNLSKRGAEMQSAVQMNEDESALITFTSGSTGVPKAADRTHGFLKEQFDALLDEIKPKPVDIDMTALPIVLFVNLGVGCTSVIADFKMSKPDELDVEKLWNNLSENRVNRIIASPFMVVKLAEYIMQLKMPLENIQQVFTGGAPVFPKDAKLFSDAFPTAEVTLAYGSTECEPISSISAVELAATLESKSEGLAVGSVYHKTELKIIPISDEEIILESASGLNELELSAEIIGEIIVAGPHVLKRYFKNPKAFKENKIVVDGEIWHRTGDSGFLKNGKLFLTGRCGQLISRGEEYISPFIAESRLNAMDEVSMGTVIEIKNEIILVAETAISSEEVKEKVGGSFYYDKAVMLKNIPRDPRHNSKIDYPKLKEKLEKTLES